MNFDPIKRGEFRILTFHFVLFMDIQKSMKWNWIESEKYNFFRNQIMDSKSKGSVGKLTKFCIRIKIWFFWLHRIPFHVFWMSQKSCQNAQCVKDWFLVFDFCIRFRQRRKVIKKFFQRCFARNLIRVSSAALLLCTCLSFPLASSSSSFSRTSFQAWRKALKYMAKQKRVEKERKNLGNEWCLWR